MKIRTRRATCTVEIDDATFEMEQLTPQERVDMLNKCTDVVGKGPDRKVETNHHKLNLLAFLAQCKKWEGLSDEDGVELELTPENVREAYNFDHGVIVSALEKSRTYFDERLDLAEKN